VLGGRRDEMPVVSDELVRVDPDAMSFAALTTWLRFLRGGMPDQIHRTYCDTDQLLSLGDGEW